MNENERMKIVVGLDTCVQYMRAVIIAMRDISDEDLPEWQGRGGDGFYNACETKLKQVRDMSRLGYERLKIECEHQNQVRSNYTWLEHVDDGDGIKLFSSAEPESTYNDEAFAEYRRRRTDNQ